LRARPIDVVPRAALPERERTLAFLATIEDLNFDPVNEFSYPDTGCRLVEAAVEARGIALETGLMEHFFSPLGVHAAPPWDQADVVPGLVPGYWPGRMAGVTASQACSTVRPTEFQQIPNSSSAVCGRCSLVAVRLTVCWNDWQISQHSGFGHDCLSTYLNTHHTE
jgi:CubicO group peptidase (beta-lactamase class C family)